MIVHYDPLPREIEPSTLSEMEQRLLKMLWEAFSDYHASDEDKKLFVKALILAYQLHSEKERKSGESYFIHDMRCTIRCLIMRFELVMATIMLLHEFIEDDGWTYHRLRREFNQTIANSVAAVSKQLKSDRITRLERAERHIEKIRLEVIGRGNYRSALAKEIDRHDNTHDTAGLNHESLEQLFSETEKLFLPLFHELELYIPPAYLPAYLNYRFEIHYACDNYQLSVSRV